MKMYQGDAMRRGVIDAVGPKRRPELLWSYDFGHCLREEWIHPFVHGGKVYFTAYEILYAFQCETGEMIWKQEDCLGTPAIDGDVIYTIGRTAMKALDVDTGNPMWSTEADGAFLSPWQENNCVLKPSPVIDDETVVICSEGTSLFALDRTDGHVLWKARGHSDFSIGSPTLGEGKIFASTLNSPNPEMPDEEEWKRKSVEKPYALPYSYQFPDRVEGKLAYERQGTPELRRVMEIDWKRNEAREKIADASFLAFDAKTGEQLWRTKAVDLAPAPRNVLGPTAYRGSVVYGAVSPSWWNKGKAHAEFVALDAGTGKRLWHVGIPKLPLVYTPISLRGNCAYLSGYGKGVVRVNLETRKEEWFYQNESINEVCNRTIVEPEGVMYFGVAGRRKTDMAGAFLAVELESGKELWRWNFPGAQDLDYPYIIGAPAIADGRVYFATMTDEDELTHRGKFYCLGVQ